MIAVPTRSHADNPTQPAAHTSLSGTMPRPIKIALLGAGSSFTPQLAGDLLRIPGDCGGTLALVDVDASRLEISHHLLELLCAKLANPRRHTVATTIRTEALAGCDYVINCIEVSGLECVHWEHDLPARYGIDVCHSVQGTSELLARYVGTPFTELAWEYAGINHLAWFTRPEHRSENLCPRLRAQFAAEIATGIQEFEAGLTLGDVSENSHEPFMALLLDPLSATVCTPAELRA